MNRALLHLAALGLALGFSGCATPSAPIPPTVLDLSSADLVASESLGMWLGPGGPRECWLRITSGRDAGKTWHVVPAEVERDPDGRLTAFTLRWTLEGEAEPRSERRMLVTPEGELSMSRVLQRDRSVVTLFDPPVLLMPARLNAGATVRQDVAVTVLEMSNPKKVKDKGSALAEVTYAGTGRMHADSASASSDAGAQPGQRVLVSVLRINLSAAKSERTTSRVFDDSGLVSESFEEKIRVLGVTIDATRQTMILTGRGDPTCGDTGAPHPPPRDDESKR